jgi:predicted DNA-binding protein (UPF0278 family)
MIELKGIKRAEKMLEVFGEGLVYREIGQIYGISKTRVYLELKKYFPKEVKKILAKREWFVGKRKPRTFDKCICNNCYKEFISKYSTYNPKFCSKKCQGAYMSRVYKMN